MTKKHLLAPFVKAGMINKETEIFPVFEKLMDTCKRWVPGKKEIGIKMEKKQHCRDQFENITQIQRKIGATTYPDILSVGLSKDERTASIHSLRLILDMFNSYR